MRTLMWFRSDLRTTDNTALLHATRDADHGVIAVFIFTPTQWHQHDWGNPKADFIRRCVAQLSDALSTHNIALRILTVDTFNGVPEALDTLCAQTGCDRVYANREYEFNEQRRDAAVADRLSDSGRSLRVFHDQTIVPPDELRTGKGTYYTVFTPYKKSWLDHVENLGGVQLVDDPTKQPKMIGSPDPLPDTVPGFDTPADSITNTWPAGESVARKKLASFISHWLDDYKNKRDFPDIGATSTLSPHLAAGTISPRRCVRATAEANEGKLASGSMGAAHWISEIAWREFYKHILVGYPRVSRGRAFIEKTERIRWEDNDDLFKAWCAGRTGYPIVDVGIRQMLTTGWMHNRVRMVVAMFLTKDLFIDWRKGERFFMQHFVDADLANNNGGWQWSASTGTDAAPYFRIFNPLSQSKKFDPKGAYIKQYCPELAELEPKLLHDPASIPHDMRERIDYPDMVVDHSVVRDRAIATFKDL